MHEIGEEIIDSIKETLFEKFRHFKRNDLYIYVNSRHIMYIQSYLKPCCYDNKKTFLFGIEAKIHLGYNIVIRTKKFGTTQENQLSIEF